MLPAPPAPAAPTALAVCVAPAAPTVPTAPVVQAPATPTAATLTSAALACAASIAGSGSGMTVVPGKGACRCDADVSAPLLPEGELEDWTLCEVSSVGSSWCEDVTWDSA